MNEANEDEVEGMEAPTAMEVLPTLTIRRGREDAAMVKAEGKEVARERKAGNRPANSPPLPGMATLKVVILSLPSVHRG